MADNFEKRSFLVSRDPSIDRRFRPRPAAHQRRNLFDGGIEEEVSSESEDYDENEENEEPTTATSTDIDEEQDSLVHGTLVYLRFRPTSEESAFSTRANVLIVAPSSSEGNKISNNKNTIEKQYVFSDIFHRDIPQAEVYENCVRMKVDTEDSFTLLTYGTSGSGKTHTLLGTELQPGIIPRSLENIFSLYRQKIYPTASIKLINGRIFIMDDDNIKQEQELRKNLLSGCASNDSMESTRGIILKEHTFPDPIDDDISVFVWINFIEIYNENVFDLLEATQNSKSNNMAPPTRRALKIVGNDGNVFVKDLTSVYVKSSVEALHLLKYGLQRVNYAATSINQNSSRSHCIFTIDILKFSRAGDYTHISYRFCDLAGSERLLKTANVGSRLKEAQRINTSLLVLGRCLDAANSNCTRKKKHDIIPYRESKLTMLLQSALLGKEKLSMIVNIMPTDKYYEENINVLGFASIAKNIVYKQPTNKMQKSRCSFLSDHLQITAPSTQENEAQLELLKENIYLRSEFSRLSNNLEQAKSNHKMELEMLEQNLRSQLTKKHKELTEMRVQNVETRRKAELASLERKWQQKFDAMKRELEWEIADLHEELTKYKKSKKRRTSVSLIAEQAKRPAVEINLIDSEDDDDEATDLSSNSSVNSLPENELQVSASKEESKTSENSSKQPEIGNHKAALNNNQSLEAHSVEQAVAVTLDLTEPTLNVVEIAGNKADNE